MTEHDPTNPAADGLVAELAQYGTVLVAFSGGVDSSVVLAAAVRALGPERVAAVTAVSPALPAVELDLARRFCATLGVRHHLIATRELEVAGYRDNGPRRCYFCKSTLLDTVLGTTVAASFAAVATGTNASDLAAGFRPGIRAGVERGARTPLADRCLDKAAVRMIARSWGLSTWDKPAAACLSSRIAYGVTITPTRLARVERAEAGVRGRLGRWGVRDVRVRDLGDRVRIEVDTALVDRARADPDLMGVVAAAGFADLPVSVEAFRSGAMNESLDDAHRWR
jgi:uncharacterized protein